MLDLETIIVLVLLAFSFIPHRLHYTLTLFRSRFIDSETATREVYDKVDFAANRLHYTTRGRHNSHQSGVVSITVELDFHNREKLCSVQEEQLRAQNTSLRYP